MQFTVDAAVLARAIKQLNLRRNMGSYVFLQAQNGTLRLTTQAYSNDGRIQASIVLTDGITIEAEGSYAAEYTLLARTLKTFDGKVTLRREESAVIVSRTGTFTHQSPVPGQSPDITSAPDLEGTTYEESKTTYEECPSCATRTRKNHRDTYRINRTVTQTARAGWGSFATLLNRVKWAVDEYAYNHHWRTGIVMRLAGGTLSFMAGNTYAAVAARESLPDGESWQHGILLPGKALVHVHKLFPKTSEILVEAVIAEHQLIKRDDEDVSDAEPFFKGSVVRLSADNFRVSLSLLNESFPDLPQVPDPQLRIVCSTADLLDAVEAASQTAEDSQINIWMHAGETRLGIEARHHLASVSALHEIPLIEHSGQPVSLLMNWSCLLAAVRAIPGPQALLEFGAPDKPLLIRSNTGQDAYVALVKPIQVA